MAAEGGFGVSLSRAVEDVLQQHGRARSTDHDVESRRAEDAASRRNEAAVWLRKMVGVEGANDLPAEPSENELRLGLRNGRILCNALNKVYPRAVPKVVETPCDASLIPDGAALSVYQYFENVRNFLVAVQELGLPTFEASDLEQGGKSGRVVNCVLALKTYDEGKHVSGNGVCKYGGTVKPTIPVKTLVRKNLEPFASSLMKNLSAKEISLNAPSSDFKSNQMPHSSFGTLVQTLLSDRKAEEVPALLESVLTKVMDDIQSEVKKTPSKVVAISHDNMPLETGSFGDKGEEHIHNKFISDEDLKNQHLKWQILDRQQRDIQELKQCLCATKAGIEFMQMKFQEEFYNFSVHIRGLAHAASRYNQVLAENRKLYNQVQDLKGSIRVYCRVRPFLGGQSNYPSVVDHIEEENIVINTCSKFGKGHRSFSFNKIFGPSATQAEVFADTEPLIRSVLDGYNVCIFAYGQTGSGKTYTMTGPKELNVQSQGVNYRALGDLFLLSEQRRDAFRYDISVQMVEIYNEQVRDLLATDGLNRRLEIRNSCNTGVNVPNANLVPVSTTSDVMTLMNIGQRNRAVGATALNDRSSRSHSCLTVHVHGRDLTSGTILRGCLHLVDLAGSERVDKSEAIGDRLKEAQHINKSLSALGDVIYSLAQKNPHVPYRNSKLTQLLQDSLGGQAKTLMFVHISPEPDAVGETISTLKFAERVASVELGAARVNKDGSDVKELKEQIASLKAALSRKEEEPVQIQHGFVDAEENRKKESSVLSPSKSNRQVGFVVADRSSCRQPMGDVGNIEVGKAKNNSLLRQPRQCVDLDEQLENSPTWPPVSSPKQDYRGDHKELGLGEWEDKVMVNKLGVAMPRVENPSGCWESDDHRTLAEPFYPNCHPDSPVVYRDKSYNLFMANNRFDTANFKDLDDLDANTSDSERDLLWQLNQEKLSRMTNGIRTITRKNAPKLVKNRVATSKKLVPPVGPTPLMKPSNGLRISRLGGRQPISDGKWKAGNKR